jgi:hypothetical protein
VQFYSLQLCCCLQLFTLRDEKFQHDFEENYYFMDSQSAAYQDLLYLDCLWFATSPTERFL